MIETMWSDLRYAVRSFRRTPGFAAAALLTLSLGIGANTAIFTLLDAVMFKPLNVPAPADLVTLYEQPREGEPDAPGGTGRYLRFSYPHFERLRAALGTGGSLAAMTPTSTFVVRLPGQNRAESVRAQLVSGVPVTARAQNPAASGYSLDQIPVLGGRLSKRSATLPVSYRRQSRLAACSTTAPTPARTSWTAIAPAARSI